MIFEDRCLLNADKFTIKPNSWDYKILTTEGRWLFNDCFREVASNTCFTVDIF